MCEREREGDIDKDDIRTDKPRESRTDSNCVKEIETEGDHRELTFCPVDKERDRYRDKNKKERYR